MISISWSGVWWPPVGDDGRSYIGKRRVKMKFVVHGIAEDTISSPNAFLAPGQGYPLEGPGAVQSSICEFALRQAQFLSSLGYDFPDLEEILVATCG